MQPPWPDAVYVDIEISDVTRIECGLYIVTNSEYSQYVIDFDSQSAFIAADRQWADEDGLSCFVGHMAQTYGHTYVIGRNYLDGVHIKNVIYYDDDHVFMRDISAHWIVRRPRKR